MRRRSHEGARDAEGRRVLGQHARHADAQGPVGPDRQRHVQGDLLPSDSRDKAFSIGYTELPKGVKGNLHGAIKGGAANVGGTVRDEKLTEYQGYKARDARITGAADNKGTLFVCAILAKGRLYLLQFIGDGPNLKKAPAAYSEIVASLKID